MKKIKSSIKNPPERKNAFSSMKLLMNKTTKDFKLRPENKTYTKLSKLRITYNQYETSLKKNYKNREGIIDEMRRKSSSFRKLGSMLEETTSKLYRT